MRREYYSARISAFLKIDVDVILGQLLIHSEFETTDMQKDAWCREIKILQEQLAEFADGEIAFEYTIPRIGHRIDVVCLVMGTIFLLEFKVGERDYKKSANDQVMDYALDLKYFHEASKDRYIVPISIATEAPEANITIEFMEDRIAEVVLGNKNNIGKIVYKTIARVNTNSITMADWMNSGYAPTPTIIEAAQAMYRNHSVQDISRNDAGAQNLSTTTAAIGKIIDDCKLNHKKAICFVTGVPGAGKTLAGLNIANARHHFESDEHAVFLSGNGPLVDVLQEALARDQVKREGITKEDAKRQTKAFIQIIHKFRDEALTTSKPPLEKVVIFDEAQRAWNKGKLSDFMKRKKGVPDFNHSESEFLISIMDRHQDWATIICLVGGGQEIYTGEAGIEDWFRALREQYINWDIYLSEKMTDAEYIGELPVKRLLCGAKIHYESSLHLGVSLRSFRNEKLSAFVKALLDNQPEIAAGFYSELSVSYPIFVTRNFASAKEWIRAKARGTERYGLLASSEGKRLRGEGIWVLSEIKHVSWFLNGKDNVDSSYYLEVAASEFKVQGLEIDYGLLAWEIDLRYVNGNFDHYCFRGTSWNHINILQRQKYQKNAYRVLLTRARQGLIIYVPAGTDASVDASRDRYLYDDIFNYLISCGIQELTK